MDESVVLSATASLIYLSAFFLIFGIDIGRPGLFFNVLALAGVGLVAASAAMFSGVALAAAAAGWVAAAGSVLAAWAAAAAAWAWACVAASWTVGGIIFFLSYY